MRKFPYSTLLCILFASLITSLPAQKVNETLSADDATDRVDQNISSYAAQLKTNEYHDVSMIAASDDPPKNVSSVSGTMRIPTDFPSIDSALRYISVNGGLSGPTILELQSNYSSFLETFPITIGPIAGSSFTNTLTIRPASDATALTISSPAPIFDPNNLTFFLPPPKLITIDLQGATNVILDGRPGGTGNQSQLTIQNFSIAGNAIRFVYGASNNSVNYCGLEGVNQPSQYTNSPSVVLFDSTGGVNGQNINDIISHCLIRGVGDTVGVYN